MSFYFNLKRRSFTVFFAFHPSVGDLNELVANNRWFWRNTNWNTFWIANNFPGVVLAFQTAFSVTDLVTSVTFQVTVLLFASPLTIWNRGYLISG